MGNLRYDMKKACLTNFCEDGSGKQIQDKHTSKIYRRSIDSFCAWIKENYSINNVRQLEREGNALKFVQEYEKKLEDEGKSANTIHTYLSPICKGLGIKMNQVNKPRRLGSDMTRSRSTVNNRQGKTERVAEKYKRLIEFQKMTGIRRSELARLKVNDFAKDESGYLCVSVSRGKGGKSQLQRILPEDIPKMREFVKNLLKSIEQSEVARAKIHIFTAEEMNNKIDLHAMRAEHAREAYQVYAERCKTAEGKMLLQKELVARWNACHSKNEQILKLEDGYKAMSGAGYRFIREFSVKGKYQLRGTNKTRCMVLGRPIAYDRTALLAVSVYHLSHWRNDVTVKHYML